MSDNLSDGESDYYGALVDGLIDNDGNLTEKGEREMGAFPGSSPFYDGDAVVPGKLVQRNTSEDKPIVKAVKTAAAINYEDLYYRLDRAITSVESDDKLRRLQGLDELYELRDEIYRGLR